MSQMDYKAMLVEQNIQVMKMTETIESLRVEKSSLENEYRIILGCHNARQKAIDEMNIEIPKLRAELAEAREVIEWYANWDWSDKYVQAVPLKARKFLERHK